MSSASATRASRQAAKKASTKFEAQLVSSPVKESSPAKPVKRARSRPPSKKEQSKGSAGLSKSAPPRQTFKKRPIPVDSRSDGNESDLTSLSRASPVPKSQSAPSTSWSNMDLDTDSSYVWVLVNFNGDVFRLVDEDDGEERIWWPAQVIPSEKPTYRVRLFGTLRKSSKAVVEVETPHAENVLPFAKPSDEIRYTEPEYSISFPKHIPSPSKRRKVDKADLEAKWIAAVSKAVHDYEQDVVPPIAFLRSVSGIPKHASPAPDDAVSVSDDTLSELSESARWSPPPPDTTLDIPGEKILARESKSSKYYWPALILGYIAPSRPSERGLYEIKWVDERTAQIPRELFYSVEEDGFGTCLEGPYTSTFDEVQNDTDEQDELDSVRRRGRSPEPRDPLPGAAAFCNLGVHEQFVYTKPVLQAILCDRYPPARSKHNMYMSGKIKAQNQLLQGASQSRGLMDPRHVEEFQRCLFEWCLRDTAQVVLEREESEQLELDVGNAEAVAEARNSVVAAQVVAEVENPQSAKACSDPEDLTAPLSLSDSTNGNENPTMQEKLCNPPSPTPTTEATEFASSPAPLPPPSSFASFATEFPSEAEEVVHEEQEIFSHTEDVPALEPVTPDAFDTSSVLSEASDVSSLIAAPEAPRPSKIDYCMNVLLPELLIQISVWRTGKRTSVELLSQEEEADLHALGEAELRKRDWVFDVKRMRGEEGGGVEETRGGGGGDGVAAEESVEAGNLVMGHEVRGLHVPTEIFAEIFVLCLPTSRFVVPSLTAAPLAVSGVCRRWRDAALSAPLLWKSLFLDGNKLVTPESGYIDFCRQWLFRAGPSPLSLSLVAPSASQDFISPLIDLVRELSQQWQDVELKLGDLRQILTFPPREYPLLEKISIVSPTVGLLISFLNAPKLREASISPYTAHIHLPRHQLTAFGSQNMGVRPFWGFVRDAPNLVECSLTIGEWEPSALRRGVLSLPKLQSLTLGSTARTPIYLPNVLHMRLLDYLETPALKSLSLSCPDPALQAWGSNQDILPLLPFVARSSFQLHILSLSFFRTTTPTLVQCLRAMPSLVHLKLKLIVDISTFLIQLSLRSNQLLPQLESLHLVVPFGNLNLERSMVSDVASLLHNRWSLSSGAQLRSFRFVHDTDSSWFAEALAAHLDMDQFAAEGMSLYVGRAVASIDDF
ncbi:hypothetical protein MSAN_01053600 [Mycena sanguinolenta]|uniref:F-box domain-containing protein n=1 Tax=Mycena sanguinolenta TaxID=230812 RepID=A0A8H6YPS5_9AGAR|nr:hypothetical protein MSAN_01053600 [Mycena sanguinolenta]